MASIGNLLESFRKELIERRAAEFADRPHSRVPSDVWKLVLSFAGRDWFCGGGAAHDQGADDGPHTALRRRARGVKRALCET